VRLLRAGGLITREDDTKEALAVRLRDYREKTNPVLDVSRRNESVITVDAWPAPEAGQQEIGQKPGLPPLKPSEFMSREPIPEEARSA
jgi:adenylate kinase